MRITINEAIFGPDQLDELCASYDANGFAHLRGLFTEAELAACQAELAEVHERVAAAPDDSALAPHRGSPVFFEPRAVIDGKPYTHLVNSVGSLAPTTRATFEHPALRWIARRILGEEACLHPRALMYQDARGDAASTYTRLGWHCDAGAWPDDLRHLLPSMGVTVHLDPTGPANGFLRVLPGSHLTYDPPDGLSFESLDGEVYQLTERGDVTFLHSHCWHNATRPSADGRLGTRRHFRGAWRRSAEPGLEDMTEEQRATYVMPSPAVR